MKKLFAALGTAAAAASAALLLAAPAHAEPLNRCFVDTRTAIAEGHTSCDFAHNVRMARFGQPGNPVLAYSPETGRLYSMLCLRGYDIAFVDGSSVTGATRCVDAEGGNAVAYVW